MYKIVKAWETMQNIQRLPTTRIESSYNLLEHSFRVMSLFKFFCKAEGIEYDLKVLDLVSNHDVLEVVTGDLMWQVKNFNDKTKEYWQGIEDELLSAPENSYLRQYSDHALRDHMTEKQHAMFKACDTLCLWIFCKREYDVVNSKELIEVIRNCEENGLSSARKHFPSINNFMIKYFEE